MAKIVKSLTELIGNTPLLSLTNYNKKHAPNAEIIVNVSLMTFFLVVQAG